MDWALLALVAITIGAFLLIYPKIDNKISIEMKYPGLIANLPLILDGVDFMISKFYPQVPYRILITVVKQLIVDYSTDKTVSETELSKLVNYVLNTKFSAQVLLSKDPADISESIKSKVDSEVNKLLGNIIID